MKYKSELIAEILEQRGHELPSLHYQSECVETWIEENKGAYPKLCDYESEWLNYIVEKPIGNFPYETFIGTDGTINNVVPYDYKSAILIGSTKYRDIDTGEFLETFEEGRNLELVSVKMPDLMTFNRENMFKYFMNKVVSVYTTYSDLKFRKNYGSVNVKHVPSPLTFGYTQLVSSVKMDKGTYKFSCKIKVQNIGDTYKVIVNKFYTTNDKVATSLIETIDYVGYVSSNIGETFIYLYSWNEKQVEYYDIMITKLSNEDITGAYVDDYKTNILTVNEPIELRGIGDVQDTLDLLTGELTQRIGEVVLDENNSTNFIFKGISDNTLSFWCMHNASSPFVNISKGEDLKTLLCDKFARKTNFNEDVELIHSGTGAFVLRILKNKLQTQDINGLTLYLQSNPITVQYKLATESVKTVDLSITNQDGETLNKIKPIEGTMYITTNGTPIKPTLEAEIPVEAITQNLSSFIEE